MSLYSFVFLTRDFKSSEEMPHFVKMTEVSIVSRTLSLGPSVFNTAFTAILAFGR